MFTVNMFQVTSEGIIFSVKVIPNSGEFCIAGMDAWRKVVRVKVKNPALHGKANDELVKELSKQLKAEIQIVKGATSHEKVVLARNVSLDKLQERLHLNA